MNSNQLSKLKTAWRNEAFIGAEDLMENCIAWISVNLNPEDVFAPPDLEYWAEQNGYEKKARPE